MKVLLLVAALFGLACAGDYGKKNEVIKHVEYNAGYQEHGYTSSYVYHGRYPGKCGNDGFYYNDKNSFVICSNGNAYNQKCAPGSENSGYSHYEYGKQYYYHDFCDVNLVDQGYAARHAGYYGGYDGYNGAAHYGHGGYGGYGGYGAGYGYDHGYGHGGYGHGGYGHDGYGHDGYGYGGYGHDGYGHDGYGHDGYGHGNGYGQYDSYHGHDYHAEGHYDKHSDYSAPSYKGYDKK
ncbi:hypothetical protein LSH36_623g03084 [Paralvinella palmiformis]|uniref:Uncharacterized protein n=1 Tax=Paralvinella palmiformis TaxID=53620 RepID=A0AAD9J555_9ANNE|nr:hypothetical protein LSH36_623g03084 [Paralvinella palmiformis]